MLAGVCMCFDLTVVDLDNDVTVLDDSVCKARVPAAIALSCLLVVHYSRTCSFTPLAAY
jgi:hypothetical protein